LAAVKEKEIPLERFLKKSLDFQGFKIEPKEEDSTAIYQITFNYLKKYARNVLDSWPI